MVMRGHRKACATPSESLGIIRRDSNPVVPPLRDKDRRHGLDIGSRAPLGASVSAPRDHRRRTLPDGRDETSGSYFSMPASYRTALMPFCPAFAARPGRLSRRHPRSDPS